MLVVDFLADNLNQGGVAVEFDVGGMNAAHVVDDVYVVRGDNLRAVSPVGLVAVVFLGVVGGSDVHAALAAEFTDGEGEFGGGAEVVEEEHLDTVSREDVGHDFGKFAGIVADVVSHGHLDFLEVCESLFQIVGQALGCGTDGIFVHAVCACAHDAAQTARAEFEVLVERLDEVGFIGIVEHSLDGGACFGVVTVAEPFLGFCCYLFQKFGLVIHVSYEVRGLKNLCWRAVALDVSQS